MTNGAFAHNVAVGQELLGGFVKILLGGYFIKIAFVVHGTEKLLRGLVVDGTRGARIDIEGDPELLKRSFDDGVVFVYHFLGSNALFFGLDGNGHAVLIRTADKSYILAF
ncbi:hypothetical protein D9M69_687020 [compost metagenome]